MRRILLILTLLLTLVCLPAAAQTDAQFSQYYEVPTYYNPAAVGRTDFLSIHGGGRMQWVGVKNAPKSFLLSADMPFKVFGKRIGAGIVMGQESIGLYKTLTLDAQLGYKFKKWGGEFTAAVQLGMYDRSFKGTEVVLPDDDDYHEGTDDGIPRTDINGTAIDFGAGLVYTHKLFWASLSATHLTAPTITMKDKNEEEKQYEFNTARSYYFMAGGNIPIKNTLFEVQPSMLLKTDGTSFVGEATARLRYNKFLSGGVAYRLNDAVSLMIGAELKNFFLGYAYDYPTSKVSGGSSGSHEVFLRYNIKLNMGEKNKNKHKSIRIM